ncbi:MAG: formate dehydrogenase accessory sulfurtransferase FdhD [Candidatus Binatia bacterium]
MSDRLFIHGTITRLAGEKPANDEDKLAVEEPLEIRLGRSAVAVTMRTPGHDTELAAGFLYTEGVIRGAQDIETISGPDRRLPNVVCVKLRRGVRFDRRRLRRYFHATSSCGLCGKTTLEAIQVKTKPVSTDITIPAALLYSLPQKLREEQAAFDETGGLHAAAIFDQGGDLLWIREDVGRHNAVDKVVGVALLEKKLPLDRHVLVVSGRVGFEIMQKALMARIAAVAAVSAPSSLAVALARKFKMTLVGFLRGTSCNVYAGAQRIEV